MEDFKRALIATINGSALPLDCKYYIVKDVFREIETLYYNKLKEVESGDNTEAQTKSDSVRNSSES